MFFQKYVPEGISLKFDLGLLIVIDSVPYGNISDKTIDKPIMMAPTQVMMLHPVIVESRT